MHVDPRAKRRISTQLSALVLIAALAAFGAAGCGGGGGGEEQPGGETPIVTTVEPGQGLVIQQVEFDYPGGVEPGSTWGRLLIDPVALGREAKLNEGYISLVTEQGWAVVNVPVPAPGQPAHAVFFNLGLSQSGEIGDIQVDVKHSNIGLQDPKPFLAERATWAVTKWVDRAYGIGPVEELKLQPPEFGPAVLQLEDLPIFQLLTFAHYQALTNIQCARNQCYPMAWANALQFIEDTTTINIPNDHGMGIGVVGTTGYNSLVGQLDDYANRSVSSRTSGSGVWFDPMISGVFEYLDDNSVTGLTFRHQDDGYGSTIPAANYTAHSRTSTFDGALATWDWIDARVQDGCGITLVFQAHAVRVTGAGKTLGQPWIRYTHDSAQAPSDSSGLENVVTFLSDTNGNGRLNMGGSSREVEFVQAACP